MTSRVESIKDVLKVGVGARCRVRLRAYKLSDFCTGSVHPEDTYSKRERVHARDVHRLNLLDEPLLGSYGRQWLSLGKHATYAFSIEEAHIARAQGAQLRCFAIVKPFDIAGLLALAGGIRLQHRDLKRIRN